MRYLVSFLLLLFLGSCARLSVGRQAPLFTAHAVGKGDISLSAMQGRKVLLSFMRNVGCPVCNLHTHHLRLYADSLQRLGVEVLMIHQSPIETIEKYLQQDERTWTFTFVSDQERILYEAYHVKPSFFRFVGSAFRGALSKRKKGIKLYKTKIPQEGKRGMLGADFLLDESGKIIALHYARYIGDHLTPEAIYRLFKK